ncbi:MAG: hypothetical protein BMS9Abin02_1499 [Anaerolineae bacterium]|nr:MAG: hypothetical protein BMS9Abin02_1499 [Anaerolineae bacterium]
MASPVDVYIPKVVVAHPNAQHSHKLAVALQKAGMLQAYCTGLYTAWNQPPFNYLTWLPHPLRKRIEKKVFHRFRRNHPELDPARVKTIGIWSNIAMATLFRAGAKTPWAMNGFQNQLARFQQQVAEISRATADIMVLYDMNAYFGLLATENTTIIRVLDMASTHPIVRNEVYRVEAARWPAFSDQMVILSRQSLRFAQLQLEPIMADYLLVGSEWVKSTCVANGVTPERIYVVHYGVDTTLFYPRNLQSDVRLKPFCILYIGNASTGKGFPYLIQTLQLLTDLDIELICCGVNSGQLSVNQDLGRVRLSFKGYQSHGEIARLMRESDMLFHPTVLEGFSLTCLEAMASGLPVLTTPRSGTAEIIEDGHNGFVVPVGNIEAMQKVVNRLYQKPEFGRQVAMAARATAEKYSWGTYEQKIGQVFSEIYRRGKPQIQIQEGVRVT